VQKDGCVIHSHTRFGGFFIARDNPYQSQETAA